MKPLHEVGIIKEGKEIVGAVMKKGDVTANTPYLIGDMSTFIKSVKANQVQYLTWDYNKDKIVPYYDEEELRFISRQGHC